MDSIFFLYFLSPSLLSSSELRPFTFRPSRNPSSLLPRSRDEPADRESRNSKPPFFTTLARRECVLAGGRQTAWAPRNQQPPLPRRSSLDKAHTDKGRPTLLQVSRSFCAKPCVVLTKTHRRQPAADYVLLTTARRRVSSLFSPFIFSSHSHLLPRSSCGKSALKLIKPLGATPLRLTTPVKHLFSFLLVEIEDVDLYSPPNAFLVPTPLILLSFCALPSRVIS